MVTIEQAVTKYLKFLRMTQRISSAKTYGNHLRVWMTWLDEAGITTEAGVVITRYTDLIHANSVEVVSAFYAYLKTRRKCDGTLLHNNAVRSFQHAIRALWHYCCDQKMWTPEHCPLAHNAVALVPMTSQAANHREHATVAQVQAMLDACAGFDKERERTLHYAVMQVFLTTGIRRNEMIHLEVSDYDRNARTLHVRVAKGGTPRYQRLDEVTCKALDHYLTLRGKFVRGHWKRLESRAWHLVADDTAPDFLFTLSEKRHLGDKAVTSLFRRLRAKAGLPANVQITPHTLRHFQCTRICDVAGIRAAQRFAGHKSERTTWKYIRKTNDAEMDAILEKVQMRPASPVPPGNMTLPSNGNAPPSPSPAPKRRRFDLRKA